MNDTETGAATVAEGLLARLRGSGVEFLFANAGTDFASIVEALARAGGDGDATPRALVCAHENLAVGMAHGHAMVSGRTQSVMVHVNVGTANAVCGLLNAEREQIPILFMAGRTPLHEEGVPGCRNLNIHWAQEMFDQAGLVRETVRWDYELRDGRQLADVLDRALAMAESEPRGPVYLTLPREVLAAPLPDGVARRPRRMAPASGTGPDPAAVAAAAGVLAGARSPLVITAAAGRDPRAAEALARLAERHALPVVEAMPRYVCLPSDHPMHAGFDPAPLLGEADAVLALDCDVPWVPRNAAPGPGCRVIQMGADPLFRRYPVRSFPADVTVAATPRLAIEALDEALEAAGAGAGGDARREAAAGRRAERDRARTEAVERAAAARPMGAAWISHCVNEAKGDDAIVVNEYPLQRAVTDFTRPGSYFGSSPAGGLGWGLPAALGAKLAAPERTVIACLGDGSYLFANPAACHLAARAHDLPILIVLFNNDEWAAVRRANRAMYPDGHAARANASPLSSLAPGTPFEKLVECWDGHGERVDDPAALPGALARALAAVRDEGRLALVNVMCA